MTPDVNEYCVRQSHRIVLTFRGGFKLFSRTGSAHRITLARPRLTIRKYGDIVALEKGIYAILQIVPNTLLSGVFTEYTIEDEYLFSLR